jgi:hypothetical protein
VVALAPTAHRLRRPCPQAACPSLDGTAAKTAQQRQPRKSAAAAAPFKSRGTRRRSLRLQPRALAPLTPKKPPPDATEARGTLTSLADEWAATVDNDNVRSKSSARRRSLRIQDSARNISPKRGASGKTSPFKDSAAKSPSTCRSVKSLGKSPPAVNFAKKLQSKPRSAKKRLSSKKHSRESGKSNGAALPSLKRLDLEVKEEATQTHNKCHVAVPPLKMFSFEEDDALADPPSSFVVTSAQKKCHVACPALNMSSLAEAVSKNTCASSSRTG